MDAESQNGHNESFNGVFRDGCLNRWLFESLREAREAWLREYNEQRPHGSLEGLICLEMELRNEGGSLIDCLKP
ncbi:MAG: transposase [bacterium]|nr:transposase [bacterium]